MDYNIDKQNPGISDDELRSLMRNYDIQFPQSYIDFLRYSNGFQSINSDLIYSSEEIKERNQYYEIDKYMPNYFAIEDGDGEYVYLMKRGSLSKEIFMYDSISIAINNCLPERVFQAFYSFIDFIAKDRFVEENDTIDCYSISLTKPVSDMKLIVKMKKVFNYNGDLEPVFTS